MALGEPWPPQQPVSIALCLSSSPSTALTSLLSSCYNLIHPSQTRSSSPSSYKQSSFHHLPWHCSPLPFSLHIQPSFPLSFDEFPNILSVYGSIQVFIISNSPNIPLLDRPIAFRYAVCNIFCARPIPKDTKITIHYLIHCIAIVIHFATDVNLSFSLSAVGNFTSLLE